MKQCVKGESVVRRSFHQKHTIRKHRRLHKSLSRRSRRKRSKNRYYSSLKQSRIRRRTEDLCSDFTVFDITDMEWVPSVSTDVAEWHKQEQISYWKSRALSLEYENRMLIQHIRNVYAKQTEDYANYSKNNNLPLGDTDNEDKKQIEYKKMEAKEEKITDDLQNMEKVDVGRREEMEELYGKMAPKIMGMETAVQLNFDRQITEGGAVPHWPHTPLNLKFNN